MTGAAGQIAYSLLYSVAKGDVFGPNQVSKLFMQDQLHLTTRNIHTDYDGWMKIHDIMFVRDKISVIDDQKNKSDLLVCP